MNNSTFFKVVVLIVFGGVVAFIVTPKYSTTMGGKMKINRITGQAYIRHGRTWTNMENEKKRQSLDEIFKGTWFKRLFGVRKSRPPIESFLVKPKQIQSDKAKPDNSSITTKTNLINPPCLKPPCSEIHTKYNSRTGQTFPEQYSFDPTTQEKLERLQ